MPWAARAPAVSNLLRLLELAPEVCELVEQRQLEMGHARALLALEQRRQPDRSGEPGGEEGALGARDRGSGAAPAAHRRAGSAAAADLPARDPNVKRLEDDLAEKLGARVAIQQGSGGKGRLVVSYNSLDELDGILAHIQ